MPRPVGTTGRKQLTVEDRQLVRTLFFEEKKSQAQIRNITKFSEHQIRHAIRAKSAAIGARPGRPKKVKTFEQEQQQQQSDEATSNLKVEESKTEKVTLSDQQQQQQQQQQKEGPVTGTTAAAAEHAGDTAT
ncbi:hypothetical protein B0H63DRAFT_45502 [Podospora didyma]|uniref:Uncharacterized protein n=1 Tax=Podospora didyma TaxID=330526 RepID=A0AAE0P6Z7_9PEZI|nr:hypothetical protein B0H63DRAFT_45502 [Podospora didyma]